MVEWMIGGKANLLCGVWASAELLSFQFLPMTAQIPCGEADLKRTIHTHNRASVEPTSTVCGFIRYLARSCSSVGHFHRCQRCVWHLGFSHSMNVTSRSIYTHTRTHTQEIRTDTELIGNNPLNISMRHNKKKTNNKIVTKQDWTHSSTDRSDLAKSSKHTHVCTHTNEWRWDGTPEAKQWDVLRNGWDGGSEGQGAYLQVRQTGWPLLGAAARVCADARRHVAVKRVCVPGFGDIITGGHLPGNNTQVVSHHAWGGRKIMWDFFFQI